MSKKLTEQEVSLAIELSHIPEAKLNRQQRELRDSLAIRLEQENADLKRQIHESRQQRLRFTRGVKEYLWEDLGATESYVVRTVMASDYPVVLNPHTMKSGRVVFSYLATREAGEFSERPQPAELRLLDWIWMLHEAIQDGDAELAALLGMMVAHGRIEAGQPDVTQRVTRVMNRLRARAPRSKPGLGKRAVLIAFRKGCRDTASVRNFFDEWKGRCLDDQWGGVSLDCDDEIDGWELIDEGGVRRAGDLPRKSIRRSGLPSMVSRAKEWEKEHP